MAAIDGGRTEQAYHDLAVQLLDRLQERGEWYNALVHVALDAAHGNLAQAIEWADQAYEKHPQELADVTEAGGGAVTSGTTANVNVVQTDVEEAAAPHPHFTGIDAHGHKWIDGKQVKRDDQRWAYSGTHHSRIDSIAKHGVGPAQSSYGDRYSEYDDGNHIFFSDDPEYIREHYGNEARGNVVMRFPWPEDAKKDQNTFGRILPKQFASKVDVPPHHVEVFKNGTWVPVKEPEHAAYVDAFNHDPSLTTADDVAEANQALEEADSDYRVVPNEPEDGEYGFKAIPLDTVLEEYGEDFHIDSDPETGRLVTADSPNYFHERVQELAAHPQEWAGHLNSRPVNQDDIDRLSTYLNDDPEQADAIVPRPDKQPESWGVESKEDLASEFPDGWQIKGGGRSPWYVGPRS